MLEKQTYHGAVGEGFLCVLFSPQGFGAQRVDFGAVFCGHDRHVAQASEVGAERHVQAVRDAVGRVLDAADASDEDARREDGRVAACLDHFARLEAGVAGYVAHIGADGASALPLQVAEEAMAAYAAADARLGVDGGQHEGVARPGVVDDAHHASAGHDAHLGPDAVAFAAVDDEVVVGPCHRVRHHLGRYEPVACEAFAHKAFRDRRVVVEVGQALAQGVDLPLEQDVAVGQFAVHRLQLRIGLHVAIEAADAGRDVIGRGEPDAALVGVEIEEEHEAHGFEREEQDPMVVFAEELQQVVHGADAFSSGLSDSHGRGVRACRLVVRGCLEGGRRERRPGLTI